MAYSATVLHVLIASPSDVEEERKIIERALHDWNSLNSEQMGIVLLPVMWESHSVPAMGDRPQGVINRQVVRACDMLIGSFWTRLGSPTGVEDSGTVEEIKWFLKNNKPVMLYYSSRDIPQGRLDLRQIESLANFKASIKDKGLQHDYSDGIDLAQKLSRHLMRLVREIQVGTIVSASAVKRAASEEPVQASQEEATPEGIFLEDYTDKAFVVRGNTLSVADRMRELNGKWISTKSGGKAWMFSKRHIEKVAAALGVASTLRRKP
jgi:hypothetical protein